jgi:hypothetical protein
MATQPQFLKRNEAPAAAETPAVRLEAVPAAQDRYLLRALPFEDVYFRPKTIDNSRLVREVDPRSRGACWSVIGVAGLALVLLGGVLAPNVANTVSGYKLEALRVEAQNLADERRTLELTEAELLSPARLDKLAQAQHLVAPSADQIVHLENRGEGKVAMVKR